MPDTNVFEQLRGRIIAVLFPVPIGTTLSDESGVVCTIVQVCTGGSQWSNRTWERTIKGWATLSPDGQIIAESLASSLWDGSNHHHRTDEPTCRYEHGDVGARLVPASGKLTRQYAERLPVAIQRYMDECAREVEANNATLPSL